MLPFSKGVFVDEETFVAGGFDKVPVLYKKSGGKWK